MRSGLEAALALAQPFAPPAGEGGTREAQPGRGLRTRPCMTPALALFARMARRAAHRRRRVGRRVFFLILVAVMPFALGPDLDLLARLGPAILWIAALLATLLGLDRLFQADHEDGSLDHAGQRLAAARALPCWSNAPRTGRRAPCRSSS